MRCALAALLALSLPTAGTAAPAKDGPLQNDSRLNAKMSVARRNVPLGTLLPVLGKELEVPLTAARETADDKVTLFVDQRPATEVLSRMAEHFGFTWIKNGKGYQITQDLKSRREEAALRDRERVAQLADLRARMERITALAAFSPEQLEERRDEAATRVRRNDIPVEEGKGLLEEIDAIVALGQPGSRASVAAYRSLNAAQLRLLSSGQPLRFSSAEGSLPPAIVQQAHEATKELRGGPRILSATLGGVGGVTLGPPPAPSGPPTRVDLTIRLGSTSMMRSTMPSRSPGSRLDFSFTCHYGADGKQMITPVGWSPNPALRTSPSATTTDDPVLKQQVTLKSPSDAERAPAPVASPRFVLQPGSITLGEVAERIHQITKLEVLADSFIHARVMPARVTARQELVQVLDTIASELDYTWEKDGNLIRFRSAYFYYARPAEVPDRILKPWEEQVLQHGAPGLNDLASLAAALTDAQAEGMDRYWTWYLEKSKIAPMESRDGFYTAREHFRFWAGLTPLQRQAALNGDMLPVARMSRIQAQAFSRAVNSDEAQGASGPGQLMIRQGGGPEPPPGPVAPAAVAAGGFRLRASEQKFTAMSGTTEDGKSFSFRTSGIPRGGQPMLPNLPGLTINSSVEQVVDQFTFSYHLAGDSVPPRSARISVPRAQPKPPQ